jgi:tRNA pseudouridine55 synthase
VRTLAEDVGEALGCGASVSSLRRTAVGPFPGEDMVSLEHLEALAEEGPAALDAILLPMEAAVAHWPRVDLAEGLAFYVRQGQPVLVPHAPTAGWVQLYGRGDRFLGVGEVLDDGRIAPKRLVRG